MSRSGSSAESPPSREFKAKRRAADSVGHDLAMALRTAYLTMHRRSNAEFARFGLTADQFVVLSALVEEDEATQKELTRRTASDPNTMSEMLGRLERRGLVTRVRDAEDGRARRVSLTESGRETRKRAWEGVAGFRGALARSLPADDLADLVKRLRLIAEVVIEPGRDV